MVINNKTENLKVDISSGKKNNPIEKKKEQETPFSATIPKKNVERSLTPPPREEKKSNLSQNSMKITKITIQSHVLLKIYDC